MTFVRRWSTRAAALTPDDRLVLRDTRGELVDLERVTADDIRERCPIHVEWGANDYSIEFVV